MMNLSDIICKTNIFMFILSWIKKIRTIIDRKRHDFDEGGQLVKCHHRNLHRKSSPTFPTGLPTDLAYTKIIKSHSKWLNFKLKTSFIVFIGILRYIETKSGSKVALMGGGFKWWWNLCSCVCWSSLMCSQACSKRIYHQIAPKSSILQFIHPFI